VLNRPLYLVRLRGEHNIFRTDHDLAIPSRQRTNGHALFTFHAEENLAASSPQDIKHLKDHQEYRNNGAGDEEC